MADTVGIITGGTNSHQTTAADLNGVATDILTDGIVGSISNTSGSAPMTGALAVNAQGTPNMTVAVTGGFAYVTATPTGQASQRLRANIGTQNVTISANSTGSTRYDHLYIKVDPTNANNPNLAGDNVVSIAQSRSTSVTTDNGTPPAFGYKIAVVTVANGAASITAGSITDVRTQVTTIAAVTTAGGWTNLLNTLTYAGNNGGKEFTVTTPADLTNTLSPGMRLQMTRSVAPPSQSMSFTAPSSQYATKVSPAGITFTGAYTVESWVYLTSYTGNPQTILSRQDNASTTGGWSVDISGAGLVRATYGTGSTFTQFATSPSIPLNRWVHIAAVVTSVASKTAAFYINGALVASQTTLSGSTTLTQAAVDLRVGAMSATPANTYFNGYMSEVRLWSAAQTQTQIQANMGISLTGAEPNLAFLAQGNGNFNDKTANASNLTPSGGAIATQVANPYNNVEYANVVSASYSAPNTTVTLNTGDYGTIPNMTLSSPQYSTQYTPFGFPSALERPALGYAQMCAAFSTTSTSPTLVTGLTTLATIPSGGRKVKITAFVNSLYPGTTTNNAVAARLSIWEGTVGVGTKVAEISQAAGAPVPATVSGIYTPTPGSKTYNVGLYTTSGTATLDASAQYPAYLLVEPA